MYTHMPILTHQSSRINKQQTTFQTMMLCSPCGFPPQIPSLGSPSGRFMLYIVVGAPTEPLSRSLRSAGTSWDTQVPSPQQLLKDKSCCWEHLGPPLGGNGFFAALG